MTSTININLEDILQAVPNKWSRQHYTGRNFVLIDIAKEDTEYEEILEALAAHNLTTSHKISRIERVQHPFAYARFKLRKEQLQKRGESANEKRIFCYLPDENRVQAALEFNLDNRRLTFREFSQYDTIRSSNCIIVVKSLRYSLNVTRDSELYPEYVIHFDD